MKIYWFTTHLKSLPKLFFKHLLTAKYVNYCVEIIHKILKTGIPIEDIIYLGTCISSAIIIMQCLEQPLYIHIMIHNLL
jgi:hypothetical protein